MKLTKLRRRTKVILSLLLALFFYVAYFVYASTGVAYIERITGVDVPWPREVREHASIDWAYATYIKISAEQAAEMMDAVNFEPCVRDPRSRDPSIDYLFGEQGAGKPFPDPSTILVHEGVGDYNTWSFYLKPETGDLWIMVYHADMSGDLPGGALKHPQEQ